MSTEGTGAATTATTQTATTEAATTQTANDWTTGFSDEAKGFVQNKGFKDASALLDSYRNMEKLMGAPKERLLRLPEKEDDPAWNDIQMRLGKPESPDKYSFKLDKEIADEKFDKWARETFHQNGLSDKQASKFMEKFAEYVKADQKAGVEAAQLKIKGEEETLKKEWGAAHEQNINLAKRAATELGVTGEQIDQLEKVIGFAGVMKFFHNIGSKTGESKFAAGDTKSNGFGILTPQQAQNRIQELRGDNGFVSRYVGGDVSARQEMERLHKFAYPEQ